MEYNLTLDNVWQFYENPQNFQATCKTCKKLKDYVDFDNFDTHLRKRHSEHLRSIIYERLAKMPQIYYNNNSCIICHDNILDGYFAGHIHDEHQIPAMVEYEIHRNKEKYFKQTGLFEVMCKVDHNCVATIQLQVNPYIGRHLSDIERLIRWKVMKKDTEYITTLDDVREHYDITFDNLEVKCKSLKCDFQRNYADSANFYNHVKKEHEEVYLHEEKYAETYPWMFFKYKNPTIARCLLCQEVLHQSSSNLEFHLNKNHPDADFSKQKYMSKRWIWKYGRNSMLKCAMLCTLCPSETCFVQLEEHFLDLNRHIQEHMQNVNLTKKEDDIPEP